MYQNFLDIWGTIWVLGAKSGLFFFQSQIHVNNCVYMIRCVYFCKHKYIYVQHCLLNDFFFR